MPAEVRGPRTACACRAKSADPARDVEEIDAMKSNDTVSRTPSPSAPPRSARTLPSPSSSSSTPSESVPLFAPTAALSSLRAPPWALTQLATPGRPHHRKILDGLAVRRASYGKSLCARPSRAPAGRGALRSRCAGVRERGRRSLDRADGAEAAEANRGARAAVGDGLGLSAARSCREGSLTAACPRVGRAACGAELGMAACRLQRTSIKRMSAKLATSETDATPIPPCAEKRCA